MLIRVRSPNGSYRYELSMNDSINLLVEKILVDCPDADPSTLALSNQPSGGEKLVSELYGSFNDLGIRHADLLFASYKKKEVDPARELVNSHTKFTGPSDVTGSTSQRKSRNNNDWRNVKELEIDQILEKEDGKISRKRDVNFCRHGGNSMCDYCMPLEPFDPSYHSDRGIKHLSFQAFLRKLNTATNKPSTGSSNVPPLEELDYKVQVPCPSATHSPFPAGICSKCQPSAITLQMQSYRMVDHVEFSNSKLIENLLDFWRKTGCQRFGFMLGRYERYEQVPLGVKAVVEAIHEPPQQGELDGVQIDLPWEQESKMEDLASICGLHVVGMIYTDLTPDETSAESKMAGKVLYKRHAYSFFLSSLETIFAANQQASRPNPSRFSASGRFSSKFVTCVITGNQEGQIDVTAYQASDQAVAMVKADIIEASVEPGTVRLKEEDRSQQATSTSLRYIPDVFYRYKNKYGIDVKENAKPCFPVDYLLVSLTHGFPDVPAPLFCSPSPFMIENRPGLHDQSMEIVIRSMAPVIKKVSLLQVNQPQSSSFDIKGKGKEQDAEDLLELQGLLRDWHLIFYIDNFGIFDREDLIQLVNFSLCQDPLYLRQRAQELLQTNSWQTLQALSQESEPERSHQNNSSNQRIEESDQSLSSGLYNDVEMGGGSGNVLPPSSGIDCPHCTFVNLIGSTDCDVCGLPLT
ncbi:NPL4 family-domain-containing protein [Phakopsora pachyrhizi]|uniref:Nuclear protein localization protein 4 n=1 Tax=Phakopsora pachyrhizi TaxID=170000 RepID=A0AAV0APW6_PHAPC|nr:NPL4 family-domain-containing protein [Phakopsora pachyrhizi]